MKVLKINNNDIITSKEIAALTGKRHDNVLRDIREMEKAWVDLDQLKFEEGSYMLKATGKQEHLMFNLTKTQSLYIVSKYNNELRAKIILRWEQLELKYQDEKVRLEQRELAKMGCPKMGYALTTQRAEAGKDTKFFHYSTEHNMVYRIVLGATAKKLKESLEIEKGESLRDNLTQMQIEAVTKIQDMNTTLIDLGVGYDDRKGTLSTFFDKRLSKGLDNEFNRLNG